MAKVLFIYTTFESNKDAKRIITTLMNEKLTYCTNRWQIKSQYVWKNKQEQCKETACILKTTTNKAKKLISRLKEIHPYETPIIAQIKPIVNKDYELYANSIFQ